MEVQPKFGQIIHKTKSTYYNTATPRLQRNQSQNLVKLYTRQSLPTSTQLLQGSSGSTAKIWSNYTQDKVYLLQHSYSKAPAEQEPKFGQIIHKIKSTYYNTATPRLQRNQSQNLVKLYTRQSLPTSTQLLQGSSGSTAKIWSNYTQDKVYLLQHSYSKAPAEPEPKFCQIIHKTKSTYYNTATPRLQRNQSQNLVKLYTRQSLHTTTQLLQGSCGTRAKIWSNYTQDKVYLLQHSYSKAPAEPEPKFGQIIHKTKSTYYNTATPRLQWNKSQNLVKLYTRQSLPTTTQLLQGCSGTRAKIWSNYTQDKVYILQHSYSKAAVEQEPKFGRIIHKTKSTYFNTATPRLQWKYSQNLVKLYTRQSLPTSTQLLQGSSGSTAKIWSNYTQDKVYLLQHSHSKAPAEQEPKFGQIIHKTKSTYYNTATPRLQRNQSQNLVKLYTRQSLPTSTQLLQGFSGTRAKIWSNYTQDKVYILQHSYSKAAVEQEPKFGQIIHKTKSTYYNTATPRLQRYQSQNLVKLYTSPSLPTSTQLLQGSSGSTAKIWSNYTQDKVYLLQHSYSKAPAEPEPKFGQIIHKTKSTYFNTATPRLQWKYSQNLVKLYTRQSLPTSTQLLQGSSGTRAKIWSNYTQDKVYLLQHSYSKAPAEPEPKFGQIIHKTKSTYFNTATPRLQWKYSQNLVKLYTRPSLPTTTQLLQGSSGTRAKILSNYTQDKVYILQHSYSKAAAEPEPKFGQIIHKTKSTYYNTATPRLLRNKSQNLVKLYTRQSLPTSTQLLQGCSGTRAKIWSNYTQDKVYILQRSYSKAPAKPELKFGQIIHKTKSTYYNTATPRLQWNKSQNLVKLYTSQSLPTSTQLLQGSSGSTAKIWSNYTQDKVYLLQHSYSKAPAEPEPKFGQIIHKTKSTYYNTATPRLQRNQSQNLVKLYTRQSLHTTTQLLQGSCGTRAKIWSNYTQDKVYLLQHSYSKAAAELEQKFGQIIHKTKSTYYNAATPRLQQNQSQNLVKLYTRQSLHTTTQLLQGCSGTRAKIWSNYTQAKVYLLQHSYSKAPVEVQPKFGQIIHKTKSTYYNTATPRLQRNQSQNLVKLYTRQSLHTSTQLLQGCSGTRAKIWSNYTQDKVYILQHSYSKAPAEQEPKFGQIIHKTKSTYFNTATPRLQRN